MHSVLSQCVSLIVISRGVSSATTEVTEQQFAKMTKAKLLPRVRPVTSHLLLHQMPVALESSVVLIVTLHGVALLLNHLVLSHERAIIAWWLQIGEVRQQVVEAHRRCSDQQATNVQLHQRLLDSQQDLQAKSPVNALLGHLGLIPETKHIFTEVFSTNFSYMGSARIMGKQVACRPSLVSCIGSVWASKTHHSSTLSGVRAMMTQVTCFTMAYRAAMRK